MVILLQVFNNRVDNCTTSIYILGGKFSNGAGVAELADAHDSKSCSLRSVGSTPTTGILLKSESNDEILTLTSIVYSMFEGVFLFV